jgi:hypothetical protein
MNCVSCLMSQMLLNILSWAGHSVRMENSLIPDLKGLGGWYDPGCQGPGSEELEECDYE